MTYQNLNYFPHKSAPLTHPLSFSPFLTPNLAGTGFFLYLSFPEIKPLDLSYAIGSLDVIDVRPFASQEKEDNRPGSCVAPIEFAPILTFPGPIEIRVCQVSK